MSPRDWLTGRIDEAYDRLEELRETLTSNTNQVDPWKFIEEDTTVHRPPSTSLTCANINSHIIPTLSLVPFYDKIYFFYDGDNYNKWDKGAHPPITNSIEFKDAHGISPKDVINLTEKGIVVPVFNHHSVEHRSDFITEKFIYKLESRGLPHLMLPHLQILMAHFQSKTKILPTSFRDPHYDLTGHLVRAGALEAAWIRHKPLPNDIEFGSILEKAQSVTSTLSVDKIALFNSMRPDFLLESFKISYSPWMPLDDYTEIFSPERRKQLHQLLQKAIQGNYSPHDYVRDVNISMRRFEEKCKTKGWRILSTLSSLARSNGSTVGVAIAGELSQQDPLGPAMGAFIAHTLKAKIPEKVKNDLNRFISEKIGDPLISIIQKQPLSLVHLMHVQKEIKEKKNEKLV